MELLIVGGRIVTETAVLDPGWLLVRSGTIAAMGAGRPPGIAGTTLDARDLTVVPGFIDLHTHGRAGLDVMEPSADALNHLGLAMAATGVVAYLATLWAAPITTLSTLLARYSLHLSDPPTGARCLGLHLEGPYLNPARRGAQPLPALAQANPAALLQLGAEYRGLIRLVTLAPELPMGQEIVTELTKQGIIVSLGHSEASYEQAQAAVEAGLSHCTHTYNALPALHHRAPGALGALLTDDRVSCEIIADLHHVHPAAIRLLVQAKGLDRVVAITDSIPAAGLPDGEYCMARQVITVANSTARLTTGELAGSLISMNQALRNLVEVVGLSLPEAIRLTSANPARRLGMAGRGLIAAGYRADLAFLDQAYRVRQTLLDGLTVYQG
ncbi:MAG: N-acetylglucosamine-6-phosphate deacetylase [Bacillota bacterium]